MDLGEALIKRLSASAGVTGIVGDRIHWVLRPQGSVLPALVLRQVSRVADDPIEADADYFESRVQADCMAGSHAVAWKLARAVRSALKEPATQGGFEFWNADVEGPIDLGEDSDKGFVHRASLDLLMRHGAET